MPAIDAFAATLTGGTEGASSSLDMASLLLHAYDIGDSINQSAEVADYLYWKTVVDNNDEVKQIQSQFAKAKELFEECQRFGRFHPDYHAAKDKVKQFEKQLGEMECVRRFKQSEQQLDDMLFEVSRVIAESVSDTIKVPSNERGSGGGCGGGGSCGCGSGGCG
ncbi:YlbF family regulator [Paenibacillus sp. HB172176]|uniref:YlbF family regulator n=1 Tax=Paenibacillus sp. HB172176 TaxID=2493690 RepID=UPI00143A9EB8|nr:YlbF family regulator [Paenibacillus sp. HB172176]